MWRSFVRQDIHTTALVFKGIRIPLHHLFDLKSCLVQISRHFLGGEQGGINRHPLPQPILGVNFACTSMEGKQQGCMGMENAAQFLKRLWHLRALQVDEASAPRQFHSSHRIAPSERYGGTGVQIRSVAEIAVASLSSLIKPKQLIMLLDELGKEVQSIWVLPPGTAQV